jgi:hypothetical protein
VSIRVNTDGARWHPVDRQQNLAAGATNPLPVILTSVPGRMVLGLNSEMTGTGKVQTVIVDCDSIQSEPFGFSLSVKTSR